LEPDFESGITYMPDNLPQTIAATLKRVIENREYENLAAGATQETFGPEGVSRSLDKFLNEVLNGAAK
jgi:hypothetical protein